ncbi:hypothetical protein Syun_031858 [Stephania yunnanensis]|uniref:Uncharacterized protein n=1 Tax=Stephania yunnanensis TaxID=152371 RepID=A0AAP0E4G0_9MAGN
MGTNLQGYHLLWPDLPTFSQLQFTARVGLEASGKRLARVSMTTLHQKSASLLQAPLAAFRYLNTAEAQVGTETLTSKAEADAVKAGKAFRPVSLQVLGRYPVLAADLPIAYRVTEARGAGDPITD